MCAGGEIPAGEIGYGEHGSGGDEQSARGEFAHDGGPEEIELFLEGDEPEVEDKRRGKADEDHPPVSDEQSEREAGTPSDVLSGQVPLHGPGKGEEGKVKRPDAQEATDLERLEIDAATGGALADEEFGDEIGAEQKEELDAHGSGGSEGGEYGCQRGAGAQLGVEVRQMRHGVVDKDQEKCEEAEDIEFGMIEALIRASGLRAGSRTLDDSE